MIPLLLLNIKLFCEVSNTSPVLIYQAVLQEPPNILSVEIDGIYFDIAVKYTMKLLGFNMLLVLALFLNYWQKKSTFHRVTVHF